MVSSLAAITPVFGGFDASVYSRFFQSLISNYYSIVIFHIMGYLVYQNGFQLGFNLHAGDSGVQQRSNDQLLENKIEVLIKAGHYSSALEYCERQIRTTQHDNLLQWERCFHLMFATSKSNTLIEFANKFLDKLSTREQTEKMAEVYLKVKANEKDYVPKSHAFRLLIAQELNELGKNKTAVNLLNRFNDNCKDTSQIIQSCKILGDALARIPGQEARAASYRKQYDLLSSNV